MTARATRKAASKGGTGSRRCEAIARGGRRCRGRAGSDGFCGFHSPRNGKLLRDGRRLGGRLRATSLQGAIVPAGTAQPPEWWALADRADIVDGLRDVARAALARRIDPRSANTVTLIAQALLAEEARKDRAGWLARELEALAVEAEALAEEAPEGLFRADAEHLARRLREAARACGR